MTWEETGSHESYQLVAAVPLDITEQGTFYGSGALQGTIVHTDTVRSQCAWHVTFKRTISLNGQYEDRTLDLNRLDWLSQSEAVRWVCAGTQHGPTYQGFEEAGPYGQIWRLKIVSIIASWEATEAQEEAQEKGLGVEFTAQIAVDDGAEANIAGWNVVMHQGEPPY
jgi:hypothetical protein